MNNFDDPYTREAIIGLLQQVRNEAASIYSDMALDIFFTGSVNAWSPAQNLEHLIKSVKPVALAMRLPKRILQLLFGTAPASSRSFHEIIEEYLSQLANGAQATGCYLPTQASPTSDQETVKAKLLSRWTRIEQELLDAIKTWHESELDRYVLPHPILGKLTVREMLFFTLYHARRHLQAGMD
jgi:hypothetical protein